MNFRYRRKNINRMKRLKNIIGNGLPYGLTLFALGCIITFVFHLPLKVSLWMSAFIAIAAVLVNGALHSRFKKPLKKLEAISIDPADGEPLLQTPANHSIDDRLVPGKLFLTNHRLLFKSYGKGEEQYAWDLSDLKPVGFYGTVWNAGGEFVLSTKTEATLMFEVDELKAWKTALAGAKQPV